MHVPRTVISDEPLDAISTSDDLSHSSTFLPPELIVDLKTFISAAAAVTDAKRQSSFQSRKPFASSSVTDLKEVRDPRDAKILFDRRGPDRK